MVTCFPCQPQTTAAHVNATKMEFCRICGEPFGEGTNERRRPKESVKDIALETKGIDFDKDPDFAPKRIHQKCYMQITRRKFCGSMIDYSDYNVEPEVNSEGEPEVVEGDVEAEDGDMEAEEGGAENGGRESCSDEDEVNITVRTCILCREEFDSKSRRDRVTIGTRKQLSHIYGISERAMEVLDNKNSMWACRVCRWKLGKCTAGEEQVNRLPHLILSFPPLNSLPSTIPKRRPERRKKDLMNMKTLTGKNKAVKLSRPELAQMTKTIENFCKDEGYDEVELGYYILYKFLSSCHRFTTARQLKTLFKKGPSTKISPRRSIANKFLSGRSHRAHRALALFLKQQLGHSVFPSREAEDQFVDAIQPRSYSFKLYSLADDPDCSNPFKDVRGLQRPLAPDCSGVEVEEADALRAQHKALVKQYKTNIAPPDFVEKYLSSHCEGPIPNLMIAIEEYDRLLAAHLHQLGPQILTKIQEINNSDCGKKIPSGRLTAKVLVVDGSDGFAGLRIISNRDERELPDHGITADFTVVRVSVKHEEEEVVMGSGVQEGRDEDEETVLALSQALSQSTIDDDSSFTGTQSSGIHSTESPRAQSPEPRASVTGAAEEGDGYTSVFEEKNPNSALVSRPIFRSHILFK